MQVNVTSCQSKFEVHWVMTEKLFNALKAIETLALGTMKVYGRPMGQGLDCPRARAWTAGMSGPGPFINLHRLLLLK